MYVKDVVVQNQVGLFARPATYFIQKANDFRSSIWVEKDDRRVNAKSLLGVLSLGIIGGTRIRIIADGLDEEDAVEALVKMVNTGFDTVDAENRAVVSSPAAFGKGSLDDILGAEDELDTEDSGF